MNAKRFAFAVIVLWFAFVLSASSQGDDFPTVAGAPPKMLLLVHQEFRSGKARERRKIDVSISHACDQLAVPNSWIDLESITGPPQALFFDPFDSFEQLDAAFVEWGGFLPRTQTLLACRRKEKRWCLAKQRSSPCAAMISAIARNLSIFPRLALCAFSKFV
jgi:hypothetical protein